MEKGRFERRDRLLVEKRHDTYRNDEKWPDPTVCSRCHAVYSNGRWTWNLVPESANYIECSACKRIAENNPAGFIEIVGDFFNEHRNEILNLVRNIEKTESTEHPMERIMSIADRKESKIITTTGIHIARRIGDALFRAYEGSLDYKYEDSETRLRVIWER